MRNTRNQVMLCVVTGIIVALTWQIIVGWSLVDFIGRSILFLMIVPIPFVLKLKSKSTANTDPK